MNIGTRAVALLLTLCLSLSLLPVSALSLGDISGGTVTLTREVYEYNGYANEPEVEVTVDGAALQRDVDFSAEYSGNVKAGTATVKIYGHGGWSGTLENTSLSGPGP